MRYAGHAICMLAILPGQAQCPWEPIVSRLSTSGLERLELCRRAQCGHLAELGGAMLCQYRGKNCEWVHLWAAWLNSGRACPLW